MFLCVEAFWSMLHMADMDWHENAFSNLNGEEESLTFKRYANMKDATDSS